jgi:hypothetical protein
MLPPVLWRVAALWRVGLRLTGLMLPPALALVGLFRGWKKGSLGDWKKISPVLLGVVALINWVVLVCFIANEKVGVDSITIFHAGFRRYWAFRSYQSSSLLAHTHFGVLSLLQTSSCYLCGSTSAMHRAIG